MQLTINWNTLLDMKWFMALSFVKCLLHLIHPSTHKAPQKWFSQNAYMEKQRKITSVNVFFASVHFACRSVHLACNYYKREKKKIMLITPVMENSSIWPVNNGCLLNNRLTIKHTVFLCHLPWEHLIARTLIEYLINNSNHFQPDLLDVWMPTES